jgi:HAMP domain-containing protein
MESGTDDALVSASKARVRLEVCLDNLYAVLRAGATMEMLGADPVALDAALQTFWSLKETIARVPIGQGLTAKELDMIPRIAEPVRLPSTTVEVDRFRQSFGRMMQVLNSSWAELVEWQKTSHDIGGSEH